MIGAVIQEFGWEQVAIISVRNELFTEVCIERKIVGECGILHENSLSRAVYKLRHTISSVLIIFDSIFIFLQLTSVMREDFSARNVKVISENLSFNTPATSDVYEDIIQRVNVNF